MNYPQKKYPKSLDKLLAMRVTKESIADFQARVRANPKMYYDNPIIKKTREQGDSESLLSLGYDEKGQIK